MSRDPFAEHDDPLVVAIRRAARHRRAARELADEELHDGGWATVDDDEAAPIRLAAESSRAIYRGGGWQVALDWREDRLVAEQTGGPGGISLVAGDAIIPLRPGAAAETTWTDLPDQIVILDARGRQVVLERVLGG